MKAHKYGLFFSILILSSTVWAELLIDWWQKPSCGATYADGAFVLPYYYDKQTNNHYYLFGRETGGKDKGLYSAFGGSRQKGEHHPMLTAVREFHEEAHLGVPDIGGWSSKKLRTHIVQHKKRVVAQKTEYGNRVVFYIIDFGTCNAKWLLANFKHGQSDDNEIDQLAQVSVQDLLHAFKHLRKGEPIKVKAQIWRNGKQMTQPEIITLRPLLLFLEGDNGFLAKHSCNLCNACKG